MAYKQRSPLATPAIANAGLRTVLTVGSQANMTTQKLGKPRKNTTGYQ